MSKRKRRRREERLSNINSNSLNNVAPFGINPAQLMNFLGGNLDFSQIGNMLSSMKNDGVDLNSYSINGNGYNQNKQMGFDLSSLQSLINSLGIGGMNFNNISNESYENSVRDSVKKVEEDYDLEEKDEEDEEIDKLEEYSDTEDNLTENSLNEDENIQMLIAVKSIVDPQKAIFIEKVIKAYNKGIFK